MSSIHIFPKANGFNQLLDVLRLKWSKTCSLSKPRIKITKMALKSESLEL